MANDDVARTISISYGVDEDLVGSTQLAAENIVFEQPTAQGLAVFVSSGDGGACARAIAPATGTPACV